MRAIRTNEVPKVIKMMAESERGLDDVRSGTMDFNRPGVAEWYQHKLSNLDAMGYLIEEDGEIVSVAMCLKDIQDKATKHVGYLSVVTRPEHRGKGFGKMLIKKILDQHLYEIYFAEILHTNEASIALFTSLGFEKYADLPHAVIKKGKIYSKLMFGKRDEYKGSQRKSS